MRSSTPTIHCDAEDGNCGDWDVDAYACTVSRVDGVPITSTNRALGWTSTNTEDFCPQHAPTETAAPTSEPS